VLATINIFLETQSMKLKHLFAAGLLLAMLAGLFVPAAVRTLAANGDPPAGVTKPEPAVEVELPADGAAIKDMETAAPGPLLLSAPTVPTAPTTQYRPGTTAPSVFLGANQGSWFINGEFGGEALYKHPDIAYPEQYGLVYDGNDARFWYVHEVDTAAGASYPDYVWAVDRLKKLRGHAIWSQRPDVDNGKWKLIDYAKAIEFPSAVPVVAR
jgi:hypothetical protein